MNLLLRTVPLLFIVGLQASRLVELSTNRRQFVFTRPVDLEPDGATQNII